MVGETLLNRYKIESELGKGGMGIVYQAHDTLLNRAVAIKFLNTEGVGTEGKARLLQEARAAAQLNHPNIVSVYDAGEIEQNPFIVMELVRGKTLRNSEKLTFSTAVNMAQQICLALDHAHTNGIIHRDLKLENIVVTNTQTLKLMDFGLARTADEARLTEDGALMGTLAYIAPELIQGQPASVQSDLYAFGVILYELMVGHAPFQGNVGTVLGQHLHGEVKPPSKFSDAIPDWVDELVLGLLSKRPEERPASAREVLDILEQKIKPPITSSYRIAPKMNNLPAQLTSFVGREKEIKEVINAISKNSLATLVGPGGTGKTRLSIQAAHESLDQYPDGVWLVELAPILDPLLVPRTTAITIGLRDEPQRPIIDMLCDYLHEKKMLILLDNCEHLVDACAQMANKILQTAPNVRILASSREGLGIAGEVTYRVPSLGLPDMSHLPSFESLGHYEAVKLFIDRATSALPTFSVTNDNAPFLAQICHRLDGIPLAIELAATKVRVLSVEQIAKRLDDRFKLLTGGSRTAMERHQTLRAAIDWSYNLLPLNEQVLFRRLSVFVDGWTLEAAESVCIDTSIKNDNVLELLEQLINKSVVITEQGQYATRYRVLEMMRQYANEKLVESGESDTLRDRHLEYFLNLAETAAPHLIQPEQLEWLAQLDADYENLRAALEWAQNKDVAEPSLRLCAALGRYWFMRTLWLEGSKWLKSALSKTAENPTRAEKAARVKALYTDADLANQLDDLERMKTSAEQSFILAQEVSDKRDIAIARYEVAVVLHRNEEYENALSLMEQSYAEFQEIDDQFWQFNAYKSLSGIFERQGKLKFSERIIRILNFARIVGERKSLAEALWLYSEWLYDSNQLDEAMKYAMEADVLFKQIGSNTSVASFFFAENAWLNGNYKEAESYYMEIQERYGLLGEKESRSFMIGNLGLLAMEQSNLDQAQAYIEEALVTARELADINFIARRLIELGIIFRLQGNMEKCRQNFRECASFTKMINPYAQRYILLLTVNYIVNQTLVISALLGVLDNSHKVNGTPLGLRFKRYYDNAETLARKALGDAAFESAFADGQKMSLDEALDLALKSVEEI